ncbi:MAG: alpha-mannosidase [Clostridiales bacterium]|jgi:alpha-mannosidase|nr:alpha-mannosidase [Clostridiales bacterium]
MNAVPLQISNLQIQANRLEALKQECLDHVIPLGAWETREGYYAGPGDYRDIEAEWSRIEAGGHWLGREGMTRWFRRAVTLPPEFAGRKVIAELEFGGEGLVFVNGKAVSSLSSWLYPCSATRSRVLLTPCAAGGEHFEIVVEACANYIERFRRYEKDIVDTAEYTFRRAVLAAVDEGVEAFYFDARLAYEAVQALENPLAPVARASQRFSPEVEGMAMACAGDMLVAGKLREALVRSLSALDDGAGREAFRASAAAASQILAEALRAIPHAPAATVIMVGHSHIDTAWLWPLKETIRKCAKTFENTFSLMEQYPEYRFSCSQPQLYAYMKAHCPDVYARIKRLVAEGRWELIGNTWVECDTNIPSGEALVRQILYGRQFFLEEFGKASEVYWLPDVFGYSWALPQIIKRSGMKYFFADKLIFNEANRFPHTLFQWQGADGTRIPAYLMRVVYNGEINPGYLHRISQESESVAALDKLLLTYGFGDGGGGPGYEMLEFARRLKRYPGLPETRIGTAAEFFGAVEPVADRLPVWNGELYYELHRGTYTSQANNKKNNRRCELLYRQAEMACVFAGGAASYPAEKLREGWRLVLLNQFHDIIPGSSVESVYRDSDNDYAKALAIGAEAQDGALSAIAAQVEAPEPSVVVFNFLSWARSGIVAARLPDGAERSFFARDIPAMGYRAFPLRDIPGGAREAVAASRQGMENGCFRLKFDDDGNITGIFDKRARREILGQGMVGNLLQIFEDLPAGGSAWNIDLEYQNKFWNLTKAEKVEVVASGPERGVVRTTRRHGRSVITQDIVLYAELPRIDFETSVSWHETEKMLKAAFPVQILSPNATYEIAYGAIERPTHWNTSWDKARFEVPAHKWADLSEGGYGVSLLNDCKYGYDIKDDTMRLTLLRAPVYPDASADQGEHTFTYALYPHEGGWREGGVVRAGYELNVPLLAVLPSGQGAELPNAWSYVSVDRENVIVEALKRSEDGSGAVLRLYESCGGRCTANIRVALPFLGAYECNLMEELERPVESAENVVALDFKPFEIKTLLLK